MKNKKIILGLGTITALGAMSVGFIACVKEEKVKEIVNGAGYSKLTKKEIEDMNLSKLTKEQVKELLANVSTLTKEQMLELIKNLSTLTKEELQELLNNSLTDKYKKALEFSMEVMDHLKQEINSNLGHFESEHKVQDVINRINKKLNDKNKKWKVVENPQRDNTTWFNSNDVKDKNGKPLKDGKQKITFRLKDENDVETMQEFDFNFFVGQKDLSTITETDKKIHHSAITKEKIVAELNKKEEFKNIDLSVEDFENIAKDDLTKPKKDAVGKVKIKAKGDSKKIKGTVELTLETVKTPLNINHIGDLKVTNLTTKENILAKINTHTDFSDDKKITLSDFDFEKVDATEKDRGGIKITPKGTTEGKSFILDISKLPISLSLDKIKNHDDIKNIKNLKDLDAVNEALKKIKIDGVTELKATLKDKSTTDVTITITIDENKYALKDKTFDIVKAIKEDGNSGNQKDKTPGL